MQIKSPINNNYAAVVCKLNHFVELPNCDNIKAALVVGGNSVIVSKDSKAGEIGLYFPVECEISHEFVSQNNLYRKSARFADLDERAAGELSTSNHPRWNSYVHPCRAGNCRGSPAPRTLGRTPRSR